MHSPAAGATSTPFGLLTAGMTCGPLSITVGEQANVRYFEAANVDHPLLRAGALYPPIAANLTVLCFGLRCPDPVIQTRQHLRCHGIARAGAALVVDGTITDVYEKRGRAYVDVEAVVRDAAAPDEPIWTSRVSFTPAATLTQS
ncbi:MAG TPA: hypothetical protein VFR41_15430 [Acidimicrobiia bacterium]|nr:hypothetical protein [Acidimicrobiia bacterium]